MMTRITSKQSTIVRRHSSCSCVSELACLLAWWKRCWMELLLYMCAWRSFYCCDCRGAV